MKLSLDREGVDSRVKVSHSLCILEFIAKQLLNLSLPFLRNFFRQLQG